MVACGGDPEDQQNVFVRLGRHRDGQLADPGNTRNQKPQIFLKPSFKYPIISVLSFFLFSLTVGERQMKPYDMNLFLKKQLPSQEN